MIIRKAEPRAEQAAEQIFTILLERASLSEHGLSKYCRKNGLYSERTAKWIHNCLTAMVMFPPIVLMMGDLLLISASA